MRASHRRFTILELLIVIALISIVLLLSIPSLIAAKQSANETNAIAGLKAMITQQFVFKEKDLDGDKRHDYGTLSELGAQNLIDSVLGTGSKAGYRFQASYSVTTSETLWFAVADPVIPGQTGGRHFGTNQQGLVFFTTGGPIPLNTTDCLIPPYVKPIQ